MRSSEAVNPEKVRLRARLDRAGLLVAPSSMNDVVVSAEELSAARAEAGSGTPLSQLVSGDRR